MDHLQDHVQSIFQATSTTSTIYTTLTSLLSLALPPLRLLHFTLLRLYYTLQANPDPRTLLTAACVLVAAFLAARTFLRYLLAQLRMAFWMAVYAGFGAVAVWIWARGLGGAWADVGEVYGFWAEQKGAWESGRKGAAAKARVEFKYPWE